ncbi:MAG TPA: peptidoglycan-binding protein, partial [Pseudolabrys sp.]|nr:peptidoglycan-binding protein [Pseudolabrys sp.]
MKFGMGQRLAVGALIAAAAMPVAAAHAQSAVQFWIQQQRQWAPPRYDDGWNDGWSRGRPGYYYRDRGYQRPYYQDDQDSYEPRDPYEPQVRVKSPQYKDYAPDQPKRVALDKICQLKLASNAEAGPPPAEPSFAAACAVTPTMTLRVLPEVGAALNDYYSNHPKFVWVEDGAVSDKARAAMSALALSGRYGLEPADYRVALPEKTNGNPDSKEAHLKAMMRFEMQLSAKVLTYVLDATRGRVDPDRMSDYYDLPRKKVDLVAALGAITKAQDVVQYLDSRNPDNPRFRALVTALAKARAAAPAQAVTIPAHTFIRPGGTDPALPQVIAAIKQNGPAALQQKHADALSSYAGGDTYDPPLVALVRDFQRGKGLNPDGVIGPNTIQAMTSATPADRIEKLKLAMERLRWLPRQFGQRYVLLNEPAYQVTYVRGDGQQPVIMRAIVGKPNHQTYFF